MMIGALYPMQQYKMAEPFQKKEEPLERGAAVGFISG